MTDDQLIQLTREVDDLLMALSIKYEVVPLSLAAIINARLIWACRETGMEDDYHKLLNTIQTKQYDTTTPIYSH